MIPSKTYSTSLKEGQISHSVWAWQINLNKVGNTLSEDGNFGPRTKEATKSYQTKNGITIDGIAGPVTQRYLAFELLRSPQKKYATPPGLIRGLAENESGWAVGAVNWDIPGGVDCGWVQRRIYEGNYTNQAFKDAFNGVVQFEKVAKELRELKDKFYASPHIDTHRRAWELAILSHNWPAAASKLASGGSLSDTDAEWVINLGVSGVRTPKQWADFYIAKATKYVTQYTV